MEASTWYLQLISNWRFKSLDCSSSISATRDTYAYLRKIIALAFLSKWEIMPMFEILQWEASTAPLQRFVEYVAVIWVYGNTWPPSSWSIFKMAVQTNNDIEGWHHGLNCRAVERWQCHFIYWSNRYTEKPSSLPFRSGWCLKRSSKEFRGRTTDPYKVKCLTTGRITWRTVLQLNSFWWQAGI